MITPKITNLGYSNLWTDMSTILGYALNFQKLITKLFANGEQGFFYDPNDLSTMYQDAVGTIPVTATGQLVGLVLDKSKGLKLGVELFNQFNSTLSSTLSQNTLPCVVTSTVSAGVFGVVAANIFQAGVYKIEFTWSGNSNQAEMGVQLPNGNNLYLGTGVTGSFWKVMNFTSTGEFSITKSAPQVGQTFTVSAVSIKKIDGNHAYQTVSASRPVLRQTPILGNELVVNGDFSNGINGWQNALTTSTVENGRAKVTYTNGGGLFQDILVTLGKTYKVSKKVESISGSTDVLYVYGSVGFSPIIGSSPPTTFNIYVTAVSSSIRVYLNKAGAGEAYWDDVSVKEVIGYHTDQNYLVFDGADDFLQTNNIDFTATDKVGLFVGVRKMSDTFASVVFETGTDTASINGTFGLYAPRFNGQDRFTFASRGTATTLSNITEVPSPIYSVVTAKAQISTDLNRIYFNSNQKSNSSSTDQGTGNYGNRPLYIGRRGGTSLPFNGHIYSLIGIGRLTTDSETTALEKELAKRVGVTLSV